MVCTENGVLAGSLTGPGAVQLVAEPEIVHITVAPAPTTKCMSRDAPVPGGALSRNVKSRATRSTDGETVW